MNREETEQYAEVVEMVKDIKFSNDSLSQALGVRLDGEIARRLREESDDIDEKMNKIGLFIAGKEKNYVDPGTARRMAALKQHFRIQRDRRNNLKSSLWEQQQMEEKHLDAGTTCDSIEEEGSSERNRKIVIDSLEAKQGEKLETNSK